MPAPFVLVDEPLDAVSVGDTVTLPDDADHHVRRVLRLRDGSAIEISDGAGRRLAGTLTATGVRADGEMIEDPAPRPRLFVLQGLPQGRKYDDVVRMLVELGVDDIAAVVAERTQHRPRPDQVAKLQRRWHAVARAACEQARRSHLPRLHGPSTLDDALAAVANLDGDGVLLTAHLGAAVDPLQAIDGTAPAWVAVAVGPEGGWSPDEAAQFERAGARIVSLGRSVLRTEHAAIVLAGIAAAGTGRMAVAADPWE